MNKNRKNAGRLLCLLLSLTLLLSACAGSESEPSGTHSPEPSRPPQQVFPLTDSPVYKEESVYVNLRADGSVMSTSVTDRIHTDMPQVRVEDVSTLSDISDVKTYITPVYDDGKMYWDMEGTDLYYNGRTDAEPPVSVSIKYYLDGKEISSDKLAGKSGSVRIEISAENLLTRTGSAGALTCPMLFVGGLILPEDSFGNVKAENAMIIGDGSRKVVFFAGIPGMNDSLALDSLPMPLLGDGLTKTEYAVTADTESFSLGNMMFAAVPLSSVFALGGEGALDGVEGIKGVLSDIEGLMNAFSGLDVGKLMQLLYGGAEQAAALISAVGEASSLYSENRELLELLDKYVTEENLALFERLINELEAFDSSSLQKLLGSAELQRFMGFLSIFDRSLGTISGLSGDLTALSELANGLRSELENEAVKQSVDRLPETVNRLRALVEVMKDSRETLDGIQSLLSGDTLEKISSVAEKYKDLGALSEAQAEHLALRMREWLAFGQEYDIFTARTEAASSSVMFIYKTAAI